jgi:hypothetical protein
MPTGGRLKAMKSAFHPIEGDGRARRDRPHTGASESSDVLKVFFEEFRDLKTADFRDFRLVDAG